MSTKKKLFGWIDFPQRTLFQNEQHERIVAGMSPFPAARLYRDERGRYACWRIAQKLFGGPLKYNWQVTGSCVGAGGGNMCKTNQLVEIVAGDLERYTEIWWPFTYGRSRYRGGMTRPGEGSFGSAWAEAATKDGFVAVEEVQGVSFAEKSGWLQLSSATEIKWSDGDAQQSLDCLTLARTHLFGAAAVIRDSAEARAAHQNGYCITLASNFGTRGPRKRGNPPVNVAEWDDTWPHQMYSDESWDHPDLGLIHRIGNNWGPGAHPEPTQGEPIGGFYVTAATFDKICKSGEVYAFSGLNGWQARTFDSFL